MVEDSADHVVVRVDVSDTGVGIDPTRLATLFEPFTQADASTTRTHGGTGSGLAISARLAELMGGSLIPPLDSPAFDGPAATVHRTLDPRAGKSVEQIDGAGLPTLKVRALLARLKLDGHSERCESGWRRPI